MVLLLAVAHAHTPTITTFAAGEDWCAYIRREVPGADGALFYPGDVLLFGPGEHAGCAFEAPVPDEGDELTILQSADPDDRARLGPLVVSGDDVLLIGVDLLPTPPGQTALTILDGRSIWLRDARVDGIVGTGVAVRGVSDDVWILDDRFEGRGIGVDIACEGCRVHVRDGLFTNSTIGVRAGPGAVLEATDLVLSSVGTGLSVAGGASTSMLTGHLVLDAELGVEITGPAVTLRSSIVRATTTLRASPGAQPRVLGNTLLGTVDLPDAAEVVGNASDADLGSGNVQCGPSDLFGPDAGDFWPTAGSALLGAGVDAVDDALFEDFCHQERTEPRTAGALQADGTHHEVFAVGFKKELACLDAPGPLPTGVSEPEATCGCAADAGATGWRALRVLRRR
ncbi:MAG: hypothetical protein H6736_00905 [Alphaproteobacteria bacterium]|nr:hypothetical protein [Alphaproteobacteria bacterium]MCB9690350.1 hypothetical protein [Alphaproteobacteria bacterium]